MFIGHAHFIKSANDKTTIGNLNYNRYSLHRYSSKLPRVNFGNMSTKTKTAELASLETLGGLPGAYTASPASQMLPVVWYWDFSRLIFWFFFFGASLLVGLFCFAWLQTVVHAEFRQPLRETRGLSRAQVGDVITAVIPLTWSITMLMHASAHSSNFDETTTGAFFTIQILGYQWGWNYYLPLDLLSEWDSMQIEVGHGTWVQPQINHTYDLLLARSRSEYWRKFAAHGEWAAAHGKFSVATATAVFAAPQNSKLSLAVKPMILPQLRLNNLSATKQTAVNAATTAIVRYKVNDVTSLLTQYFRTATQLIPTLGISNSGPVNSNIDELLLDKRLRIGYAKQITRSALSLQNVSNRLNLIHKWLQPKYGLVIKEWRGHNSAVTKHLIINRLLQSTGNSVSPLNMIPVLFQKPNWVINNSSFVGTIQLDNISTHAITKLNKQANWRTGLFNNKLSNLYWVSNSYRNMNTKANLPISLYDKLNFIQGAKLCNRTLTTNWALSKPNTELSKQLLINWQLNNRQLNKAQTDYSNLVSFCYNNAVVNNYNNATTLSLKLHNQSSYLLNSFYFKFNYLNSKKSIINNIISLSVNYYNNSKLLSNLVSISGKPVVNQSVILDYVESKLCTSKLLKLNHNYYKINKLWPNLNWKFINTIISNKTSFDSVIVEQTSTVKEQLTSYTNNDNQISLFIKFKQNLLFIINNYFIINWIINNSYTLNVINNSYPINLYLFWINIQVNLITNIVWFIINNVINYLLYIENFNFLIYLIYNSIIIKMYAQFSNYCRLQFNWYSLYITYLFKTLSFIFFINLISLLFNNKLHISVLEYCLLFTVNILLILIKINDIFMNILSIFIINILNYLSNQILNIYYLFNIFYLIFYNWLYYFTKININLSFNFILLKLDWVLGIELRFWIIMLLTLLLDQLFIMTITSIKWVTYIISYIIVLYVLNITETLYGMWLKYGTFIKLINNLNDKITKLLIRFILNLILNLISTSINYTYSSYLKLAITRNFVVHGGNLLSINISELTITKLWGMALFNYNYIIYMHLALWYDNLVDYLISLNIVLFTYNLLRITYLYFRLSITIATLLFKYGFNLITKIMWNALYIYTSCLIWVKGFTAIYNTIIGWVLRAFIKVYLLKPYSSIKVYIYNTYIHTKPRHFVAPTYMYISLNDIFVIFWFRLRYCLLKVSYNLYKLFCLQATNCINNINNIKTFCFNTLFKIKLIYSLQINLIAALYIIHCYVLLFSWHVILFFINADIYNIYNSLIWRLLNHLILNLLQMQIIYVNTVSQLYKLLQPTNTLSISNNKYSIYCISLAEANAPIKLDLQFTSNLSNILFSLYGERTLNFELNISANLSSTVINPTHELELLEITDSAPSVEDSGISQYKLVNSLEREQVAARIKTEVQYPIQSINLLDWRNSWYLEAALETQPVERLYKSFIARRPQTGVYAVNYANIENVTARDINQLRAVIAGIGNNWQQGTQSRFVLPLKKLRYTPAVLDTEAFTRVALPVLTTPQPGLDLDSAFISQKWSRDFTVSRTVDHSQRYRSIWGPLYLPLRVSINEGLGKHSFRVQGGHEAAFLAWPKRSVRNTLSHWGWQKHKTSSPLTSNIRLNSSSTTALGVASNQLGELSNWALLWTQAPSNNTNHKYLSNSWWATEARLALSRWELLGLRSVYRGTLLNQMYTVRARRWSNNMLIDSLLNYKCNKEIKPNTNKLNNATQPYLPLTERLGDARRLRVTARFCLPSDTAIHAIFSARDVIHTWNVPLLNVKVDCIPGFSSHRRLLFRWRGFAVGQCAEVCGRYHHQMAIAVDIVSPHLFIRWVAAHMHIADSSASYNSKRIKLPNPRWLAAALCSELRNTDIL